MIYNKILLTEMEESDIALKKRAYDEMSEKNDEKAELADTFVRKASDCSRQSQNPKASQPKSPNNQSRKSSRVDLNESDKKLEKQTSDDDLRVCVQGINEFMKDFEIYKELNKIFADAPLEIAAVQKEPKRTFAFIRFKTLADTERFKSFPDLKIKNRLVKVRPGHLSAKQIKKEKEASRLENKINEVQESYKEQFKMKEVPKIESQSDVVALVSQKVSPFAECSYETQIAKKKENIIDLLKKIKEIGRKNCQSGFYHNMKWLETDETDFFCDQKDFVECDEENRNFYRNKTEFSIGRSAWNDSIVVGFNCGDRHSSSVERGQACEDVPTVAKPAFEIGLICEEFIKTSKLGLYHMGTREGFWRNVTIRHSDRTNEVLVNIIGCKRGFTEELIQSELLTNFKDFFMQQYQKNHILKDYKQTGLLFQNHDEISDVVPINPDGYTQIFGEKTVYNERILGIDFEVSPSSFLQVNIAQCEKLYTHIGEYCIEALKSDLEENEEPEEYILLDICSGIGTIGLCLGKNAKKVIGIEINEKACEDALRNAKRNNVQNYEVVVGKVEDKINEVVKLAMETGAKIIGVIDPPRAGIHPSVVLALRTCRGQDHMIFVACDLNQSKENLLKLCLPQTKKVRGPPFSPISCIGMDLFPHTPHYEALLYLKRLYE